MTTEKTSAADRAKLIFLMLYFLILTIERIISLVSVFTGDLSAYDWLEWYMAGLTICSIVGAYAYILAKCRMNARSCPGGKVSAAPSPNKDNFGRLAVAAGILLLGGMVHTEGTIPPIQFASYGMILVSMGIHTVQKIKENGGALMRWLSFGYIVAFSMSIPVVYHTQIELSWLFVPLEIAVSAGMVILFTIMLIGFYNGDGVYSFAAVPFITALVGDAAVLALRWNEEINSFVLIFICVTAVLYVIGRVYSKKYKS